jgi:hypothetical protein
MENGTVKISAPGARHPAADGALPLLLLWLLAPFILIFALGLYQEAFVKFFLVASAPLCLLLAQGIVNIGRISQRARGLPGARWSSLLWAGLGAFILIALINQTDQALRALYFDPEHARDDYRGIAATIRAVQRPGDAVLFDAPNQWEVFTFYYPDNGRLFPVARTRPVDAAAEGDELARIASSHARLFVLYWAEQQADPAGFVERWLAEHTLPAYEQWYGGVRLAVYGVDSPPITGPEHALDARLGDAVALRGVTLRGAPAHPGDIVGVALYWEALAPPPARYKVFVHLVDAGGRLVAQHDAEPGDSTAWPVGQAVADRHGVWLPQDLAPGTYVLRAGLYGVDDGLRLRVQVDGREAGEWVTLGNVQVTP